MPVYTFMRIYIVCGGSLERTHQTTVGAILVYSHASLLCIESSIMMR